MTTAERLPVVQGTPEWLAMRRTGIGSSDAPIIAGEVGSVLELWAQKAGLVEPEPPDEQTARLFEWGHRLEPVIADWYADTTGRRVERVNHMLRHPDVPWAFASLDRRVVGEKRLLEVKTSRWGWTAGEDVPGRVQVQVQHQLWVTGYDVGDVVVLTGGSEPQKFELGRNDDMIRDLAWMEAEFMDWVQTGTRPPVDGSENARRVLSKMHPRNDGTLIPSSADIERVVADWRAVREEIKASEATEATLANTLRALIGDADGIEGLVTWKKNKDSARVNWPAVAKAYRDLMGQIEYAYYEGKGRELDSLLQIDLDAIESIHTSTVEGPRVLRPAWKESKE